MRERSRGIVGTRRAMDERDRTECRLANGAAGHRKAHLFPERHPPGGRQLHDQIVRMLTIGDLQLMIRLAHLKDLRVARSPDAERFRRHAAGQRKRTTREAPCSHRHQPVLGIELRFAPSAALSFERRKYDTVESEAPRACLGAMRVLLGGILV